MTKIQGFESINKSFFITLEMLKMSGEIEEYALTDAERSAGVGSLLNEDHYRCHCYEIEDEPKDKLEDYINNYHTENVILNFWGNLNKVKSEKNIQEEKKREKEIIKLIAGLNTQATIKEKTIEKLFKNNLDYMIFTYANQESLPYDYVYLSKQKECLQILIKSILKENGYILDSNIISEITQFIKQIYTNTDMLIVYDRVGLIQKFIHNKIDEQNGIDAHLKLSSILMKHILSTARLHLNLQDIKKIESLKSIIKKSEQASNYETMHPLKILPNNLDNRFIYHKRKRDFKSLIDFAYFNISKKILDILELDEKSPIEIFKQEVIRIYTELNYFSKKGKI